MLDKENGLKENIKSCQKVQASWNISSYSFHCPGAGRARNGMGGS
jgi:hypothetical protein